MSWTETMTSQPLFQNTFILRGPRVANFADIIKIATIIIKVLLLKYLLKSSNKVTIIRNDVLKSNL